jgi:tRNA (cmo5U34)-methyltransferase
MKKKSNSRTWLSAYSKKRADEYAALMRISSGGIHADMLDAVVQAVPFSKKDPFSVIELGMGTGKLTRHLLNYYPRASICGLDGSPYMLKKAQEFLKSRSKKIRYFLRDFGGKNWKTGLNPVDLIISTAAIHHLTTEGKKRLFKQIYQQLKPGGSFIYGDPIWPDHPHLKKRNDLIWAKTIQNRLKKVPKEKKEIPVLLRWINETRKAEGDKPTSLEKQAAWLRSAGFTSVDCFWKYFGFAVLGGTKPDLKKSANNSTPHVQVH